jgi:hypothetical protein
MCHNEVTTARIALGIIGVITLWTTVELLRHHGCIRDVTLTVLLWGHFGTIMCVFVLLALAWCQPQPQRAPMRELVEQQDL